MDTSEEVRASVLDVASKIGSAMKKGLGCAGFNVVQNNGIAAGQTVFHFHVHVIPRYEGGPSIAAWKQGELSDEKREDILAKITGAMD